MWTTLTLLVCQVPFTPAAGDVTFPPPNSPTQIAPNHQPTMANQGQPTPAIPSASGLRFDDSSSHPEDNVSPSLPESQTPRSVLTQPPQQQPAMRPNRGSFQNVTPLRQQPPRARGKSPSQAQLLLQTVADSLQGQEDGARLVSLTDAVARQSDRTQQAEIVRIYWEQFSLTADLQFAHDELAKLQQAASPRDAAGSARLNAALRAAAARLQEAEMAAATSRYALAEVTGSPTGQPLMATDAPLVGDYRTLYDTLFASSGGSNPLQRIDRTLPLRKALVDARAAAVVAADQSVTAQLQAYQAGQVAIDTVLKAVDDLRIQRGSFLGAVRDYNLEVADYAFAAASPTASAQGLVAMLIEVPKAGTQAVEVTPNSAIVSNPRGSWQPSSPSQATPSAVQPASGQAIISTPPPSVLQLPQQPQALNPDGNFPQGSPALDNPPTLRFDTQP